MKKPLLFILALLVLLVIGYLSIESNSPTTTSKEDSAEQTVIDFYKWYNEKNLDKMKSLLTKRNKGASWELDKLEYVKLLKIEEDKTDQFKKDFMTYGLGKEHTFYDVRVFRIEFEINYKDGFGSGMTNGKHSMFCYVVKEKENSSWLISDWGRGI